MQSLWISQMMIYHFKNVKKGEKTMKQQNEFYAIAKKEQTDFYVSIKTTNEPLRFMRAFTMMFALP